jgi:Leucine-rich repeat (LRR) protein
MSDKELEQEKKALFDLIYSWDVKNIKLARLIWKNNPALKEAVEKEFLPILRSRDYKSLAGLKLMANLHSMNSSDKEERIQYLMNVKWLKTAHNDLTIFPEQYLRNIERLKIQSNQISTLTPEINQLRSLKVLDLSGCKKFISFPLTITDLNNLNKLNFEGTILSEKYAREKHTISGTEQIKIFFRGFLLKQ